jgi:RNA polymerase sigma-70 factor (ECF subfamily)
MNPDPSFAELLTRLRKGDDEAAALVFQRFGRRLIALAHSRLDEQLRRKIDAEDVMQSALRSFFRRQAQEGFDLEDWDSMWSLLTVITLRKCGYHTRYLRAGRRDVRREAVAAGSPDESHASWEAIAREPTPSEVVALAETVEELMRGLKANERDMVTLSLQGHTVIEISNQVKRSERTVHRVLGRVRDKLRKLREDEK